jgi:hypothetical protein
VAEQDDTNAWLSVEYRKTGTSTKPCDSLHHGPAANHETLLLVKSRILISVPCVESCLNCQKLCPISHVPCHFPRPVESRTLHLATVNAPMEPSHLDRSNRLIYQGLKINRERPITDQRVTQWADHVWQWHPGVCSEFISAEAWSWS